MIELTDELKQAFIAAAGWQAEPWRFNAEVAEGLVAVLAVGRAEVTQYTLSALPEDNINARLFSIQVAYRGRNLWAVLRMGDCLGRSGEWDYECLPSNRADEWLAGHRFELDEALRLARAELPRLRVNGLTAADLINDQDGRS